MSNLFEWFDRLKFVERSDHTVSSAVGELRSAVRGGRTLAPDRTTLRDLDAAFERLQPTYLIRLRVEFGTAVRSYYASLIHDADPRIRTADLINTVAGIRRGRAIADAVRMQVHDVREYRNSPGHERDDLAPHVPLNKAAVVSTRSWGNCRTIGTDHPPRLSRRARTITLHKCVEHSTARIGHLLPKCEAPWKWLRQPLG